MNTLDFKKFNAKIGLEYEFYTTMKPKSLKSSLNKLMNRKVVIHEDPTNKEYSQHLNNGHIVITIDKSGGIDMYEVVTPPMVYLEAKDFIQKMHKWIDDFGKTTKHSSVHINLNLPDRTLKNNLDVFKFILSFDENFVYKNFPNRKGNIYCQSIKQFYPINIHMDFKPNFKFNYNFPNTKYFGVNFSKLQKNYLEYRYIGGENYHRKDDRIINLMDYFILHLYDTIDNPSLKESDKVQFHQILNPIKDIRYKTEDYDIFKRSFPKISLSVDMKSDENIIKSFWGRIKETIFDILIKNKFIGEININYNTDIGIMELANNDNLRGVHFENVGFYNCTVTGVINRCIAVNCELDRLSAVNSKLKNCEINDGKVFNSIADSCEFNNVYVSNPEKMETYISGTFNEGIIASANAIRGELHINEKNKEEGLIKIIELIDVDEKYKLYL